MAEGINKFAIIHINYKSVNELRVALDDIYQQLKFERAFTRKTICDCVYQVAKYDHDEPNFRIETINGELCQIYKSKIHRDNVKKLRI